MSIHSCGECSLPIEDKIGLGDVVSLGFADGNYDCATVVQVNPDGTVDVHRPFTHVSDFSVAGTQKGSLALPFYVGVEMVKGVNPKRLKVLRKNSLPIR